MNKALAVLFLPFAIASSCAAQDTAEMVVQIGVIAPLSGPRADAGQYIHNGLTLAEKRAAKTPSRVQLKLNFEDSRYEPKEALAAYYKLRTVNRVSYFIGPYGTSEVLAIAPISEQDKAVVVLPGAQADEISQAGERIFRLIHNCRQEAPFFAGEVAKRMSDRPLGVISLMTAFAPSYLKSFVPALEAQGRRIGRHEEYDVTASDFRPQILKFKEEGTEHLLMIATPLQAGRIMAQAKQLGFRPHWYNIGVESPEIVRTAGDAAEGMIYPYSYDSRDSYQPVAEFAAEYRRNFNSEPDALAANSYDAFMLLHACIGQVGNDPVKVSGCLYQTKDYPGAGGRFSIDSAGDVERPLFLKTIRQGRFVRLEH